MAPGRGLGHLCWWPLIFLKEFFDLCFIGSVGFDDHLVDLSFASILLASASFGGGGGCSWAYQQIEKICKNSFLYQFISRRHRSDLHPSSMPSR